MKNATLGTFLLSAGTLLNMLRMAPIFASDGFSFENFPPHGPDGVATAALLGGWYPSHVMAIVSVPLLIGGFFTIQRKVRGATDDSLAERLTFVGLLGISAAALLYLVAGVLDGIALAHAAERYHAASDELRFVNAEILMAIHETAVSFGGHFMAGALVSSGLFAAGLRRLPNRSPLPIVGIGIGVAGLLGMVAGVLDLSFQTNFPLLGGLVGLMMMWWLALAFSQFGRMHEHAS